MRPFTRLPLCLALFTFILSSCIQNKCSLPEFEGVCQDKPSDMTSDPPGSKTYSFTYGTESGTIHSIAMIDKTPADQGPIFAFNFVKKNTFDIIITDIASLQNNTQIKSDFTDFNKGNTSGKTEGITHSDNIISFIHKQSHTNRYIGKINLTTKKRLTDTDSGSSSDAWSLDFNRHAKYFSLAYPAPRQTNKSILSISALPDFSGNSTAPTTTFDSIGRVVIGRPVDASTNHAIIWEESGRRPQLVEATQSSTPANTFLPSLDGCFVETGRLCPVVLADIFNEELDELTIARRNGIHIYANSNDKCDNACKGDIFISTPEQAQAITVSINQVKAERKLVWASSKFENETNTITIHTIPVSSIM